jgi:hypothetical protein
LEAFYYCVVLLGGGDNNMNKQALGLSPPYPWLQTLTPEEKAAAAAKKVQRAVKREVKQVMDGMVAQLVYFSRQQATSCLPISAGSRQATSCLPIPKRRRVLPPPGPLIYRPEQQLQQLQMQGFTYQASARLVCVVRTPGVVS